MAYIGLTGTFDLMKKLNLEKVYKLILLNQPISRAKISKLAELNKVTVSNCVDFLLEKEVVHELGVQQSDRGRPPTMLGINGNAGVVVGIETSTITTNVIVTDLTGKLLDRINLPDTGPNPEDFVKLLVTTIRAIETKYKIRKLGLIGAGIAIPGYYNQHSGIIEYVLNKLTWNGFSIRDQIKKNIPDIPFYIQHSSIVGAMGEVHFGQSNPSDHLAYIAGTWGLGVAIYANGKPYTGYLGFPGRIAHSIIQLNGKPCYCGNRGCLEAYASFRALFDLLYPNQSFHEKYFNEILTKVKYGDPIVMAAIHELIPYLTIGLVNVINSYNPNKICIGGYLGLLITDFVAELTAKVNQMVPEHFRKNLTVYCSKLGELGVAYGCVSIVRDHLIDLITEPK